MERTKEVGKIRWKKIGGGSLRLARGKIVKPNEIFFASEDEISPAFKHLVVPLESLPVVEKVVLPPVVSKFFVKQVAVGWYDVVSADGKAINESKLRKAAAEELLDSLK